MNRKTKTGISLLAVVLIALPFTGEPMPGSAAESTAGRGALVLCTMYSGQEAPESVTSDITWAKSWTPWALLPRSQAAFSSAVSDLKSKYCMSVTGMGFVSSPFGF